MTEVQTEFKAFRQRTKKKDEKTNFAVISGDFNIDNISPGANFINVKCMNFLYEHRFGSFYYAHVTRKKLPK